MAGHFRTLAVAGFAMLAVASGAQARDQIRIVGSSTVFPFATAVAEQFGKTTAFKTPVVESTGSGGGLKLFCAGLGIDTPDITNASRRIKKSELDNCTKNGVTEITEVKIGFDGIVFARARGVTSDKFTKAQIFEALAKEIPNAKDGTWEDNPYNTWFDIDPALPDEPIKVLGPPPTSGTRDAFAELVMDEGCATFKPCAELKSNEQALFHAKARAFREDGHYIEAGENDNLIVQKLVANPNAYGVFGFSFLDQNLDKVQASWIGDVEPSFESIAGGTYPISRSMYFYVKNAHAAVIPGIAEYIAEFTSERAWGPEGYLADKGLIPMPDEERAKWRAVALALTPLTM